MNKKIKFVMLIISILLIISISINLYFYISNKNIIKENISIKKTTSSMYKYIDSITVENFESKVLSGEEFFVYIGRPDCSDCNLFESMFKDVINEYKLNDKIIYMNIKTFREENGEIWEGFKSKYGFTQTPALIHFYNGSNIDIIEWNDEKGLPYNTLIGWLKNNNLIK